MLAQARHGELGQRHPTAKRNQHQRQYQIEEEQEPDKPWRTCSKTALGQPPVEIHESGAAPGKLPGRVVSNRHQEYDSERERQAQPQQSVTREAESAMPAERRINE